MEHPKHIEQDFIVDSLSNSILNKISEDSFQTEIIRLNKQDFNRLIFSKWNIYAG
jgi:hypothetical protein